MKTLEAIAFFFVIYAIIRLLYSFITRRVQLRVSAVTDAKYLSKQFAVVLRSYLLLQDGIRKKLLSFTILSAQLAIFLILYKNQVYGESLNNMIIGLAFFIIMLSLLLLPTDKTKKIVKLYDNHFLLLIVFYLLIVFIPSMSNVIGQFSHIIYALSVLFIGVSFTYYTIEYFNYNFNVQQKKLFTTMQAYLLIGCLTNEIFRQMESGYTKFFVNILFSLILTTIIMIASTISTAKTKEGLLSRQSYALMLLVSIMLVLLGGGLIA